MRPIGAYTLTDPTLSQWVLNRYVSASGTVLSNISSVPFNQVRTRWNSGPGWRDKLNRGQLDPAPARTQRYTLLEEFTGADVTARYPATGNLPVTFRGTSGIPSLGVNGLDSVFGIGTRTSADNKAKAKLIGNIKASDATVLTMAAEARQTAELLRNNTTDLLNRVIRYRRHLAHAIRRGRWSSINEIAERVANGWLEFHYGVEPLINDVHDIVDVLFQSGLNKAISRKVKASAKEEYVQVKSTTLTFPFFGPAGTRTDTYSRTVRYKTGLELVSMPAYQGSILSQLGLSWSGVAPALYEIIPYSFLVDYFSNVGSLVEAYTYPLPSWTHSWGTRVVEDRQAWSGALHLSNGTILGNADSGVVTTFDFQRLVNVTVLPSLEFYNWESLSQVKATSVYALLTQLASRKLRVLSMGRTWS